MKSPTQAIVESLSAQMATSIDDAITKAVTAFWKRTDWTMEELQARATKQPVGIGTVLLVDDVPLIRVWMESDFRYPERDEGSRFISGKVFVEKLFPH
jgi:hypothetical protein